MANDIMQTIAEARFDARSLSEFVFKPASFMVARRLAPSVHTLQYYVNRFETIDSSFTQALNTANAAAVTANAAAVTATNNAVGLIDSVTNNAYNQISSAIDGVAIDANLVTDALITTSIRKPNQVVRTQASKNADFINVKDFGALGDDTGATVAHWFTAGSTHYRGYADLAAVQSEYPWVASANDTIDYAAMVAAIKAAEIVFGTKAFSPTVWFPMGTYHISQEINLKSTVRLLGESSSQVNGSANASVLLFAEGCNGIIVNRHDTFGAKGSVNATTFADGSCIERLHLRQKDYIRYSVPVLDYNPADKTLVTNNAAKIPNGKAVNATDERFIEKYSATIQERLSSRLLINASNPLLDAGFGDTITGSTSGATARIIHAGIEVLGYVVDNVVGSFVLNETITSGSSSFVLQGLRSTTSVDVYVLSNEAGVLKRLDILGDASQYGSGITLRGRAMIRDCCITDFPQNGITMATDGDAVGNVNLTELTMVTMGNVGRHGLATLGGDSNAGKFTGLNASGVSGYGIYDGSFLGNHYFSCHTSVVGLGSYYSAMFNNFSVFVGCYSEGGGNWLNFSAAFGRIGRNSTIIGGDHGMPMRASYNDVQPTYINGNILDLSNALYATDGLTAGGQLQSTYTFASDNTNKTITLLSRGNINAGNGAGIEFRLPANTKEDFSRSNIDTQEGGLLKVSYEPDYNSALTVDLINKQNSNAFIEITNPGNGGRRARFRPIVVDGALTKIEIVAKGSGYSGVYTLSGTGQYSGVDATAYAHNGVIVYTKINTPLTGLVDTALVRALNVNSNSITAGVDDLTTLGTSAVRYKSVYTVNGHITNSIGLWGATPPASKPSVVGLKTPTTLAEQKAVNDSLIAALASYGLISDNRT